MTQDAAQRPAVIFMSYRRGDTQWAARGIYDRLAIRYGRGNVFRDLDAIPPGARFRDYVERKISESDVLIVLIGNAWASYQDEAGRRRLEHPRDPVRLEVETALRLEIPIIPVRVEGAPMPTERDLVPSLYDLLEFNAAEVSDSRWDYDLDRLLSAIDETVERWRRPSAPRPADADDSSGMGIAPDRRAGGERARREAEEKARQEAEEQAQREAAEKARQEAEEQAQREAAEKARQEAEEQAQREAAEKARQEAAEKARQEAAEKARQEARERARLKKKIEDERWVHPHPQVEAEPTTLIELSPTEAAAPILATPWTTARHLLRRRAVLLSTAVGVGIVVIVVIVVAFLVSAPAIMGHLPDDLRGSCRSSADKAATCRLADGTVVFFRLFDSAAEAKADVTNGAQIASADQPCPPSALPANTSVVCRYGVGPETGIAMFGYTAKDDRRFFVARWVADAEPLLRGEMSTERADPVDWTALKDNWNHLAGKS
jgi:hypothetical protein